MTYVFNPQPPANGCYNCGNHSHQTPECFYFTGKAPIEGLVQALRFERILLMLFKMRIEKIADVEIPAGLHKWAYEKTNPAYALERSFARKMIEVVEWAKNNRNIPNSLENFYYLRFRKIPSVLLLNETLAKF